MGVRTRAPDFGNRAIIMDSRARSEMDLGLCTIVAPTRFLINDTCMSFWLTTNSDSSSHEPGFPFGFRECNYVFVRK